MHKIYKQKPLKITFKNKPKIITKRYSQSVIQNFRAASGIFKKGLLRCSFTQKYLKITLFLEKRVLFCQTLQGAASYYRMLISFGLILSSYTVYCNSILENKYKVKMDKINYIKFAIEHRKCQSPPVWSIPQRSTIDIPQSIAIIKKCSVLHIMQQQYN